MPRHLSAALLAALGLACAEAERPPSVLLFVFDTTRSDDPSFANPALATTPYWDRLAAEGLVYTRAYAQAPWTLPAHASMFTGLIPSRHGAGWTSTRARDSLDTVAERLAAGGYQTLAVSENPWLTQTFNLLQGFEDSAFIRGRGPTAGAVIEKWLARDRRAGQPFFVFVNVVDPHAPYTGDETCVLPGGMSLEVARGVPADPAQIFCTSAEPRSLEILKALHRCDLRRADQKLARIHAMLAAADPSLISIVTADHGEHFGEHRLVSHQFSVRNELLGVPLVVHGLSGAAPARIEEPVATADIAPSVLAWAGQPELEGIDARPLLRRGESAPERSIVAEYADLGSLEVESELAQRLLAQGIGWRNRCGSEDPVFGSMRSVIRFPHKAIRYADHAPELFDLSVDPRESKNLAEAGRGLLAELLAQLPAVRRSPPPGAERPPPPAPEIIESLEALGYLEVRDSGSVPGPRLRATGPSGDGAPD